MKAHMLELFALTFAFVVLMYNAFALFKEGKEAQKLFIPEMINQNLKNILMQKHPYMEINYKQFLALLKAAPDQFSFWTLDEGRVKGDKVQAIQSAAAGKFHRLNPNQFWEKCDMSSTRDIDTMIRDSRKITGDLILSETWNDAMCAEDNAYWPILITFGGDLPSSCDSKDTVDIPETTTLIFFLSKKDKLRAFDKLFAYIQEKSTTANGAKEEVTTTTRKKLQNSMKGSDNMLRDIAVVRKKAEKQIAETQKEMQKLALDAKQNTCPKGG